MAMPAWLAMVFMFAHDRLDLLEQRTALPAGKSQSGDAFISIHQLAAYPLYRIRIPADLLPHGVVDDGE
ncbi:MULTISPECIES: hypothetical protein [Mesorhizobium]|uniref:hypothetical protein n=1 Tax=Mesorhizobium TaxID=68287 RepID=UPI0007EC69F4|nr:MULTISPECIES: hypothetical protein [Mesorhizobium]PBB51866.1 hypothetical protein CK223_32780 [Mesorhizobium loti]QIA25225.1 hypothetical protein A9K68_028135 [Mesorhizobium sp. AA22]